MARRLGVAREDVVSAAVRVCDREGLDGLTVAAVAAEVGCRPPSVYHHVDGLAGLVRAVTFVAAEQLLAALEAARQDDDRALPRMAAAAHDWGVRHPARFDALRRPVDAGAEPELAAARSQVMLPVQDALIELGVRPRERATLMAALVAAVRGSIAADIDGGDQQDRIDARAAGRDLLLDLLLDHIAAVATGTDDVTTGARRLDDATRANT